MTQLSPIPFGRPWITDRDRDAVLQVLQGHILVHGPQGKGFEEDFGAFVGEGSYCVAVGSGTAALHLAYFQMGLGPGDEVIVPAQTHNATAHAVELTGARPVFVDCEPGTGNMDVSKIEALITPNTRALSPVHFLGVPCDMDGIMSLAQRHGLRVVEDCALALGARYKGKHVGLIGDAGCFSFYPVKHITTGDGGMFITRHREVAETVSRMRAFGVDRTHGERTIPGMYDVTMLGFNYRMSEMQAALGRQQIAKLDEILARRQANFDRLTGLLSGIAGISTLGSTDEAASNSHYCLSIVLEAELRPHRDRVIFQLNDAGVGTSIYYPHPVPRLMYYRDKYGYEATLYPNAAAISDYSIALPVGPHLDLSAMERIATTIRDVIEGIKS